MLFVRLPCLRANGLITVVPFGKADERPDWSYEEKENKKLPQGS